MVAKIESNQLTPEEKVTKVIGLIVSGVGTCFAYVIFSIYLGSISEGLRIGISIGISIFMFFVCFGFWTLMFNVFGFFVKSNKNLDKETNTLTPVQKSPEDKLMKLKELKDSGVINEEEYNSKKQKLLNQI